MIESFRHKGLKRFYEKDERKGVPPELADKVARILARLDVANTPEQMDLPGLKLHPLKGKLRGGLFSASKGLMLRRLIWWITTKEDCFDRIQWSEPCR